MVERGINDTFSKSAHKNRTSKKGAYMPREGRDVASATELPSSTRLLRNVHNLIKRDNSSSNYRHNIQVVRVNVVAARESTRAREWFSRCELRFETHLVAIYNPRNGIHRIAKIHKSSASEAIHIARIAFTNTNATSMMP